MKTKVLVIEYFRIAERKEFWQKIIERYKNSSILEIEVCEQLREEKKYLSKNGRPFSVKPYNLVFLHDSDRYYNQGKDYANLVKDIPHIIYSGGVKEGNEKCNIEKFQIIQMPLDTLLNHAKEFFDEIEKSGQLTERAIHFLTKYPQRQRNLKLLMNFLPIHFTLQLDDINKSVNLAGDLIKQKASISNYFNKIVSINTGDISEEDVLARKTIFDALIMQVKNISELGDFSNPEISSPIKENFYMAFVKLRNLLLNEE